MKITGTKNIAAVKVAAAVAVDAAAEQARLHFITGGAAMAMVYAAKLNEARIFLAAYPSDAVREAPNPAVYPLLSAEIGITGPDIRAVAAAITARDAQWMVAAAQIERLRLQAKSSIAAAITLEAVSHAQRVDWPTS
jgi:hypothetical protein